MKSLAFFRCTSFFIAVLVVVVVLIIADLLLLLSYGTCKCCLVLLLLCLQMLLLLLLCFHFCCFVIAFMNAFMRSLGACEPLSIDSLFVNCLWEGKGGRDYLLRLVMGKPTSENPSPEDGPSFHHSACLGCLCLLQKAEASQAYQDKHESCGKRRGQHLNQGNSY